MPAAPAKHHSSPAVELAGLRFAWTKHTEPVLAIDRLTLNRGERIFLHGASGSGKSTLLGLLAGVNTPDAGSISLLGQPVNALGLAARDRFRADHIGYIFQMFNLLPWISVRENILLPCRFSRRRRQRAEPEGQSLEATLHRLLEHLDLNADLLDRKVTALSVGQQQRVAAARALIGQPELVIADEPTSALDNHRRERFVKLLFDECAQHGATVVFVSHDMTLAPLFDRAIALDKINTARSTTGASGRD